MFRVSRIPARLNRKRPMTLRADRPERPMPMRHATFWRCSIPVLLALGGGGCNNSLTDKSLVYVTPPQAQELAQGKKKLLGLAGTQSGVYVDSRREADFRAGHIPGAINLPYERVSADHSILKNHEVLIVYGNDYNDNRADGMSKRLMELGYSDVRTLIGGLRAWKSEGNPLEMGDGTKPAESQ
jgi:3-mercaptopyruvate sulfurtransferase SseA